MKLCDLHEATALSDTSCATSKKRKLPAFLEPQDSSDPLKYPGTVVYITSTKLAESVCTRLLANVSLSWPDNQQPQPQARGTEDAEQVKKSCIPGMVDDIVQWMAEPLGQVVIGFDIEWLVTFQKVTLSLKSENAFAVHCKPTT